MDSDFQTLYHLEPVSVTVSILEQEARFDVIKHIFHMVSLSIAEFCLVPDVGILLLVVCIYELIKI